MCYRGGRGVVPTDESTSIRNCGDAYDGIRPGRMIIKFRGWQRDMATQICLWHIVMKEPPHKRYSLHVKCHWGNVIQAWPITEIYAGGHVAWPITEIHDMSGEHLPVIISFVVRWHSTAELTPLRSVRPSYRFLRPRSRENLSPAGTSHFPRPWVGHVRRTAPPDRFPKVLSIWI